jgi:hypothetical protein
VQLSDPALLNALLINERPVFRRGVDRRPAKKPSDEMAPYVPPEAKSGRRRCSCGICSTCRENARWDRILAKNLLIPHTIAVSR